MPKNTIAQKLAAALAAEATSREHACALYAEVLSLDHINLDAHNALERLRAPQSAGKWMNMNAMIDPRDDIFKFFAGHPSSMNPLRDYLSDGWRTLSELMVLLETVDRPLLKMSSVLEFAAGYGRFTRHLAKAMPGRVVCSDVFPGSVEFLQEQFGVRGFYSSHHPDELKLKPEYDLVFVLSLFTHLPARMWAPWLKCLMRGLTPGGLLVLSTHNERDAVAQGVKFNDEGVHFIASSESPSIDGEVYGTIFTTREFVERTIEQTFGRPAIRISEKCFWEGQDGVVIQKTS